MKSLEQLQREGLVSQTLQSNGITVGYQILKFNGQLGQYTFSTSVYTQEQIEDEKFQRDRGWLN